MIDDHPGGKAAERSTDAVRRGHDAERQIVTPRPAHQGGDNDRRQDAKDPGPDAIEKLDCASPSVVV